MKLNPNKSMTSKMTYIAIFTALAFIIQMIAFPLPFFPAFLKFELSDVILVLVGVMIGPKEMFVTLGIRALLHWLLRGSETGIPIGLLANIVSSISYTLPVVLLLRRVRKITFSYLVMSMAVGTIVLSVVMYFANALWITPAYFQLGGAGDPSTTYFTYSYIYIPFNLIKGILVSIVSAFVCIQLPHIALTKTSSL